MAEQLQIPSKLNVGFNKRDDTYSGLLSFITYPLSDGTNKHKKAWDNWIDKKIKVQEIDNSPTEGFVINKREGGGGRWSYNEREAKIRVWDPRGFEFEITIENMLDIIATHGSYPGKGLDGKFVYAWDKLRLHLVPVKSETYKNSMEFTDLSKMSITKDELVIGGTYITKKQETAVYMGYLTWYETWYSSTEVKVVPSHVFYIGNKKNPSYDYDMKRSDFPDHTDDEWEEELKEMGPEYITEFSPLKITDIAKCIDPNPTPNFAELNEELENSDRIFRKEKIIIESTKILIAGYGEFSRYYSQQYVGEVYWIKKNDNVYEGFRLKWTFPEGSSDGGYRGNPTKANGLQIVYQKRITISDDGLAVTKCSKTDKKIYTLPEVKQMEVFSIKANMTAMVTKEIMSNTWMEKADKKINISKYSLKEIV